MELTDPVAIALKQISDSILAGDEALLGVIREVIYKMHALEVRIIELELLSHPQSMKELFDPKTGLPYNKQ